MYGIEKCRFRTGQAEQGGAIRKTTQLQEVVNFSPMIASEIGSMGYNSLEELKTVGWKTLCTRYAKTYPERLNLEIFILLGASLEGIPRRRASDELKNRAQRLVKQLTQEKESPFGYKKAKPKLKR